MDENRTSCIRISDGLKISRTPKDYYLDPIGYDSNGNMTQDWNKKIADIAYNHLNLPVKVTFSLTGENRIDYIYNALGTKVQKTVISTNVQTGTTAVVTDYLGGFQYKDEKMEFFPTAEGYVSVTDGINFNYVYNYTDHLGNIRLSYTRDNGVVKVLEENHYYPFGMRHSNYGDDRHDYVRNPDGSGYAVVEPVVRNKYQFKFQGQERQDELNLNWDSFKYRNYDYTIGRFMNIDPLAEDYNYQSPYNFAENKVIDHFELEGLEGVPTNSINRFNGWVKDKFDTAVENVQKSVSNMANSVNKFVSDAVNSGGINFTTEGGKSGGMETPQGGRNVPSLDVTVIIDGLIEIWGPETEIPGVVPDGSGNAFVSNSTNNDSNNSTEKSSNSPADSKPVEKSKDTTITVSDNNLYTVPHGNTGYLQRTSNKTKNVTVPNNQTSVDSAKNAAAKNEQKLKKEVNKSIKALPK